MKKIDFFRAERSNSAHLFRSRPLYRNNGQVSAFITVSLVIMSVLLSACSAVASTPTAIPTVSLDDGNISTNTQPGDANSITASAIVVPVKEAQLAFSSVGRVTAVDVKVGDQVSAGQILVMLDTTIQEARVREAEANLLAAQVQYNYQKRLGVDEVHIESAEADVARMQALLDSAKAILESQSVLVAPFDGTIVSVDIAPAETVIPGQVVILLGDLSRYQIETTDLSERDVTNVRVGQTANVFIDALEEEFPAKVIEIDRVSTTLGGDVVFKVTLEFGDQPEGLLWGMSADVQIEPGD